MDRLTSILIALLATLAATPSLLQARTLVVPDQLPTIQGGLTAAEEGDTVLVQPGAYTENISFLGKGVVLRSLGGPQVTTIDGSRPADQDSASVIRLINCGHRARVEGFTITGGTGVRTANRREGAGIYLFECGDLNGTGPTIHNNRILANAITGATATHGYGAGVYLGAYAPNHNIAVQVIDNVVANNQISVSGVAEGAGIYCSNSGTPASRAIVEANDVYANVCDGGLSGGAGIVVMGSDAVIRRNLVACNTAGGGPYGKAPGIAVSPTDAGPIAEQNTVVANVSLGDPGHPAVDLTFSPDGNLVFIANNVTDNTGGGIQCYRVNGGWGTVVCNNIYGNTPRNTGSECLPIIGVNDNTSLDPLYGSAACPPSPNDFCLQASSPLLPQNSPPGCGLVGARGGCSGIAAPDIESSFPRLGALVSRPNPFSQGTEITFVLERAQHVRLAVEDVAGRHVRSLFSGTLPAGVHSVSWHGRNDRGGLVRGGMYVIVLSAGQTQGVTRVLCFR